MMAVVHIADISAWTLSNEDKAQRRVVFADAESCRDDSQKMLGAAAVNDFQCTFHEIVRKMSNSSHINDVCLPFCLNNSTFYDTYEEGQIDKVAG